MVGLSHRAEQRPAKPAAPTRTRPRGRGALEMASEFTLPLLLCVAPVVIAEVGALLRDERSRKHEHRERFEQIEHRLEALEKWRSS